MVYKIGCCPVIDEAFESALKKRKNAISNITLSLTSPLIIFMEMPPDCFAGGRQPGRNKCSCQGKESGCRNDNFKITDFSRMLSNSGMPRAPIRRTLRGG